MIADDRGGIRQGPIWVPLRHARLDRADSGRLRHRVPVGGHHRPQEAHLPEAVTAKQAVSGVLQTTSSLLRPERIKRSGNFGSTRVNNWEGE